VVTVESEHAEQIVALVAADAFSICDIGTKENWPSPARDERSRRFLPMEDDVGR
jgi:hypothetical protein